MILNKKITLKRKREKKEKKRRRKRKEGRKERRKKRKKGGREEGRERGRPTLAQSQDAHPALLSLCRHLHFHPQVV